MPCLLSTADELIVQCDLCDYIGEIIGDVNASRLDMLRYSGWDIKFCYWRCPKHVGVDVLIEEIK